MSTVLYDEFQTVVETVALPCALFESALGDMSRYCPDNDYNDFIYKATDIPSRAVPSMRTLIFFQHPDRAFDFSQREPDHIPIRSEKKKTLRQESTPVKDGLKVVKDYAVFPLEVAACGLSALVNMAFSSSKQDSQNDPDRFSSVTDHVRGFISGSAGAFLTTYRKMDGKSGLSLLIRDNVRGPYDLYHKPHLLLALMGHHDDAGNIVIESIRTPRFTNQGKIGFLHQIQLSEMTKAKALAYISQTISQMMGGPYLTPKENLLAADALGVGDLAPFVQKPLPYSTSGAKHVHLS